LRSKLREPGSKSHLSGAPVARYAPHQNIN